MFVNLLLPFGRTILCASFRLFTFFVLFSAILTTPSHLRALPSAAVLSSTKMWRKKSFAAVLVGLFVRKEKKRRILSQKIFWAGWDKNCVYTISCTLNVPAPCTANCIHPPAVRPILISVVRLLNLITQKQYEKIILYAGCSFNVLRRYNFSVVYPRFFEQYKNNNRTRLKALFLPRDGWFWVHPLHQVRIVQSVWK